MTEIEITEDIVERIMADNLVVCPAVHKVLPDPNWLLSVKALLPGGAPDLCVYRHMLHGTEVLCSRVRHPRLSADVVVLQELETYQPGYSYWQWPKDLLPMPLLLLRLLPRGDEWERITRARQDAARRRQSEEDQSVEERAQAIKGLRRKGLDEAAYQMEAGITPYLSPTLHADACKEAAEVFSHTGKVTVQV